MDNILNNENESTEEKIELTKDELDASVKNVVEQVNHIKMTDKTPVKEEKSYFTNMVVGQKELNEGFRDFLKKAVNTTSNSILVPPQYSSVVIGGFGNYGVARRNAFIQTLDSNIFNIPRISTSANPAAYWLGEGVSSTASGLDTQSVQLPMKALQADVDIYKEMLNTAGYDVLQIVKNEVARKFAVAEDTQAFMGNSNPFTGVFYDSGVLNYTQVATGSITGLAYKDLVGMEAKLDPTFRDSAKFYFDSSTFAVVKGLTDTQNRPIFDSQNKTIIGYPYEVISNGVLNTTSVTSAGTKYFCLGDLKQLWIADNQNLEILVNPYLNSSTRSIRYTFTQMSAMGIAQPNALVVYKIQ